MKHEAIVWATLVATVVTRSFRANGQSTSAASGAKTLQITEERYGRHPVVMISLENGEVHKIISYNDKKDSDYQAMRAMVESFTTLKKDVQAGRGQ